MNPKNYAQLLYEVLEDKSASEQDKILDSFKSILIRTKESYLSLSIEKELNKIQHGKNQEKTTYISSASELSSGQKKQFTSLFDEPQDFLVNPNLLGGIAVRQKDKVFNATLKRKIEFLKK
jgi:F0F1-type ATP synthase delta subunit